MVRNEPKAWREEAVILPGNIGDLPRKRPLIGLDPSLSIEVLGGGGGGRHAWPEHGYEQRCGGSLQLPRGGRGRCERTLRPAGEIGLYVLGSGSQDQV